MSRLARVVLMGALVVALGVAASPSLGGPKAPPPAAERLDARDALLNGLRDEIDDLDDAARAVEDDVRALEDDEDEGDDDGDDDDGDDDDGDDDDSDRRTVVVDKDRRQCPKAQFQSIQAAVVDASTRPGSKVLVCPDTYNEEVTVPEELTVQAVRRVDYDDGDVEFDPLDPADRCFNDSPPDPKKDAIVTGGNLAFNLVGSEVVLDGFVLDKNSSGGVVTTGDSSRNRIRDNLVQDNPAAGVLLASEGSKTRVEDNCARARSGPQGTGVATDESDTRVRGNTVLRNSVAILATSGSDVEIEDNDVRDANVAYIAQGTPDLRIAHNRATATQANGIRVDDSVDAVIEDNRVRDTGFFGIQLAFDNQNAKVEDNDVRDTDFDGLLASSGLVDSTISDNTIRDSGRDGIRIDEVANAGNRIVDNELGPKNDEHDCHDDTVGPGTGGTANFWRNNEARSTMPDNRGGTICPNGKKGVSGDRAFGAGTALSGAIAYEFDARSGPNGENATGTASFSYPGVPGSTYAGGVTCLRVAGNRATLVFTDQSGSPPFGETVTFFVEDGPGGNDGIQIAVGPQPAGCPTPIPVAPSNTSGITVQDNAAGGDGGGGGGKKDDDDD